VKVCVDVRRCPVYLESAEDIIPIPQLLAQFASPLSTLLRLLATHALVSVMITNGVANPS